MQNNSIPDFPPLKWSLKVILIRDEKFFQQLLSKKDSQLSCLWEIRDFANVKSTPHRHVLTLSSLASLLYSQKASLALPPTLEVQNKP